jgi:plasmid stability protein
MAQVIIRNLEDADVAALKRMAEHDNVSLEQKLRTIVTEAARRTEERFLELSRRSLEQTRNSTLDSTALIRADRDR